jgi:hypothetical protein
MKDFYDLWYLGRQFEFGGDSLAGAIGATFERRRTPIPGDPPLALTTDFHEDAAKQTQWRAFLRRGAVADVVELRSVLDLIRSFLMPPAAAAGRGRGFASHWPRGGPWRSGSC